MTIIRKLTEADRPAYRDHLLRLSAADRRSRFCGAMGDGAIERHCDAMRREDTILVGRFESGRLRAAAELYLERDAGRAELAVSVDADLQSRGVGSALVRRAAVILRNRGIRRLAIVCMPENRRMQRIACRIAERFERGPGEAWITVTLSPPDRFSLWQEVQDDGAANIAAWLEWWWGAYRPAAAGFPGRIGPVRAA